VKLATKNKLKAQNKKPGKRTIPKKGPEVKYAKQLQALVAAVYKDIVATLTPVLAATESQYIADGYAEDIAAAFAKLRAQWIGLTLIAGEEAATRVAVDFVALTNASQKQDFYAGMNKAVGVDFSNIASEQLSGPPGSIPANMLRGGTPGTILPQAKNVNDLLQASVRENVNLIKTIPAEALDKVEKLVWASTTKGEGAKSIMRQIASRQTGKYAEDLRHARFIARDQTAKLNGNLNRIRQTNLGVEEYIWVTVGDDRVRESHARKNGRIYRWDKPPADTGHPGQDYQCRCIAQPILPKDLD
jgi:SPP1 gp7 family putative phage head morphogenesis protein